MVLRPGFYQVNVVGEIEDTVVSLSLHPHEVRNVDHITFPSEYGDIHEIKEAQQAIVAGQQALRADMEDAASAIDDKVRELEDGSASVAYLAVIPGVVGMALGSAAIVAARRPRA